MPGGEEDPTDAEDAPVLSPEELDITDDENVTEIDDGRYVITPGDDESSSSPTNVDESGVRSDDGDDPDASGFEFDEREAAPEPVGLDRETVHEWLASSVADRDTRYGFDVTAVFEGEIDQQALFSNDVALAFETLVSWYAGHVGGDTPVEEVLGILLVESNVPVRYPEASIHALVEAHDLEPGDSISDLLAALDDTVRFPP